MIKGMKTFSLAMSVMLIAGVLASCSSEDYTYPEASWKDNVIVSVGGKEYTYNDIYHLFEDKQESAQAYYDTAKNVLAQLVTPVNASIETRVDGRITQQENTWRSNAETNGTTYKEEQEKTFDDENVDNMDEYRAKLTAEEQNSVNSASYYTDKAGDENYPDSLFYISQDDTEAFVENAAPYHVSHILVQLDAGSSSTGENIWDAHISADDARQIGNVVYNLSSTSTFGNVARILSDDSSSDSYGDLGGEQGAALTKTTNYVNEFKLGIYAYDAFINHDTENERSTIKKSLQVPGENADEGEKTDSPVASSIGTTQIGQGHAYGIPASVAFRLSYVADQERADNGKKVEYTDETQYPRNILFNNYFNNHSVSFIYDDSDTYEQNFLDEVSAVYSPDAHFESIAALRSAAASDTALESRIEEYDYVMGQFDSMAESKYKEVANVSDNLYAYTYAISDSKTAEILPVGSTGNPKRILVDEGGDPIIVTRAGTGSSDSSNSASGYQGIHFIVVKEDPFLSEQGQESYKYWRTNTPDSETESASESADYNTNPSYINYIRADIGSNTEYSNRADQVRSTIKNSDSNYDFKLYEANLNTYQKNFGESFYNTLNDDDRERIENLIERYIENTRLTTENTNVDNLDSSWETYIETLNLFESLAPKRVVPTVCVSYFQKGSYGDEKMEALCHVER